MSQVLWNVSKVKAEGRHDGKFYVFAPDERKIIRSDDVANFLVTQLEMYGIVSFEENPTKEIELKAHVKGLRNRWKYCYGIVKNWQAQNKEREAGKLGAQAPTEVEENCAIEQKELLDQIDKLEGNKMTMMNEALADNRSAQALKAVQEQEETIKEDGVNLTMNRKGRPQNVATPT